MCAEKVGRMSDYTASRLYRRLLRTGDGVEGNTEAIAIASAAPMVEFLYTRGQSAVDNPARYVPHVILRKTALQVFVNRKCHDPQENILEEVVETYALDRGKLERDGYAWSSGGRRLFYTEHAVRQEQVRENPVPPCFRLLNLSLPCTVAEVKSAYRRKVRILHPDAGGNHDEFIALQSAYEAAIRFLSDQ
jgi:DnaJ domain